MAKIRLKMKKEARYKKYFFFSGPRIWIHPDVSWDCRQARIMMDTLRTARRRLNPMGKKPLLGPNGPQTTNSLVCQNNNAAKQRRTKLLI